MTSTGNTLLCNICGADRSKSGRPFDAASLAKHMTAFHQDNDATAESPLACDICGATASGRGKKFLTMASVHQHKKKCHPEGAAMPVAVDGNRNHTPPSRNGRLRPLPASATYPPGRGVSHVKYCPCCGFNLTVVNAAMEFVNGD